MSDPPAEPISKQARLRRVLEILALLAGLLMVVACILRFVPFTASYRVEAAFESTSGDDVQLLRWASEQPGIVPQSVTLQRPTGSNILRIQFQMKRPLMGEPEVPDFAGEFHRLGYRAP